MESKSVLRRKKIQMAGRISELEDFPNKCHEEKNFLDQAVTDAPEDRDWYSDRLEICEKQLKICYKWATVWKESAKWWRDWALGCDKASKEAIARYRDQADECKKALEEIKSWDEPMPCGHPLWALEYDEEGTAYCAWCESLEKVQKEKYNG